MTQKTENPIKSRFNTKSFLLLALPNILSNFIVPIAGSIDLVLLGQSPELAPVAGVALAAIIFDYLLWSFGFLRMGSTSEVSRYSGAGKTKELSQAVYRNLLLASGIGLLLIALKEPILALSLKVLSGESQAEFFTGVYYNIRIYSAPFTLCSYVVLGAFLGRQQARRVLLASVALHGLNILLTWFFVIENSWGVAGAAWATLASNVFVTLVILFFLIRDLPEKKVDWNEVFRLQALKESWALNVNLFVRTFFLLTSFSLFTNLTALFGNVFLVASTLVFRLFLFVSYFGDGFALALEAQGGHFFGAKDYRSLKESFLATMRWNLGVSLTFLLVYFVFQDSILYLLNHNPEVLKEGKRLLPYLIGVIGLGNFAFTLDGFFIATGKTFEMRRSMILSFVFSMLPFSFLAYYLNQDTLLWWGMILFMGLRSLTLGRACWNFFRSYDSTVA